MVFISQFLRVNSHKTSTSIGGKKLSEITNLSVVVLFCAYEIIWLLMIFCRIKPHSTSKNIEKDQKLCLCLSNIRALTRNIIIHCWKCT